MSDTLVDFRGRISKTADAMLAAEARAIGRDKQFVVRRIIDDWAASRAHAATVAINLLGVAGVRAAAEGSATQQGDGDMTGESNA